MPEHNADVLLQSLVQEQHQRAAQGLSRQRRTLNAATGIYVEEREGGARLLSFLSNDYLGLAAHPHLCAALAAGVQRWGAGSGASPLVSGHLGCHADAEAALAEFTGFDAALLFITGYMANLAVLTSLLDHADDVVFSDALNHASLIDGCRLARGRVVTFPHGDLVALEALLQQHPGRRRMIASDAVFSMDGDEANLTALLCLADRHDTLLLVDDAHGFGVLGPHGQGSVGAAGIRSSRLILMGTLGKAAGLSGAFVAADSRVIEHLVQRGRSYIFSTSPAPAVAAAIPTALTLIAEGGFRRQHLQHLRIALQQIADRWQFVLPVGQTPIAPVLVGEAAHTMQLAGALAGQGVLVAGIRPPTVPVGSSRLRISLSAAHQPEHLDQLQAAARAVGMERGR